MEIEDSGQTVVNDGQDGIDISSSSGGSFTFDNVRITGHAGNHGIDGSNVGDLTIINSEVFSNATLSGVDAPDVHNVRFDNLTGTTSIINSEFYGSQENIFSIFNTSGALDFNANNILVTDTAAGSPGNVGLLFDLETSAQIDAVVQNSYFTDNNARSIQYLSNDGTTSGSLQVIDSTFENSFIHVDLSHQSAGTVQYRVKGNTMNQNAGRRGRKSCDQHQHGRRFDGIDDPARACRTEHDRESGTGEFGFLRGGRHLPGRQRRRHAHHAGGR